MAMAGGTNQQYNKIALIGATGRTGGWVLDEALNRGGLDVRVLTRKKEKIPATYASRISAVVEGDATNESVLEQLLYDKRNKLLVDVVISTIGSPSKDHLVVEATATALLRVLQKHKADKLPRVVWMTSTGINEATDQAKSYPCCGSPNRFCCGYGGFGCLMFQCLIPYIIGQALWDDMGLSEDVMRSDESIYAKTVLVRPTNMYPVSEHETFTEGWKSEGGEDLNYQLINADGPPPGKWICRKAIAAALLDLAIQDTSKDGTAVSLFRKED